MSDIEINNPKQIGNAIITKFINEEIMTKSELGSHLDRIMEKHTKHIDAKFEAMNTKFETKFEAMNTKITDLRQDVDTKFHRVDVRYNWIIGTTLSVGAALAGLIITLFNFTSHLH